jgi:hypothetical protein
MYCFDPSAVVWVIGYWILGFVCNLVLVNCDLKSLVLVICDLKSLVLVIWDLTSLVLLICDLIKKWGPDKISSPHLV